MNPNPFSYSNFLGDTSVFRKLFEKYEYPWEALPGIEEFIKEFKGSSESSEYEEISENLFVGKNVAIDDTARISGAAIIGHNTTLGHAAFVRGGVLIGDNVNIGHASEVKHSVILGGTKVAHLNYIGDSIIGSDSNISGGATLANWRLDKKEIEVKNGEQRIPTHMTKFGSVVGDGSFIGVGAVINPGCILAKGCVVFPLMSVKGTYPEKTVIK